MLCVRCQLPICEGGLDSTAIFVDGGNIFDPYFIAETSRQLGLSPEKALNNIRISRAFTSHQLTTLITEELIRVLDQYGSKLVVISNITELYCDPDTGKRETKEIFNHITIYLEKLAKEREIIIVATSLPPQTKRKWSLDQYLTGRAQTVARVEAADHFIRVTLEKHPTKPPAFVDIRFEAPRIESMLEDYVEG